MSETKKHNIDDLRSHLFDTLEALKDKTNPMELERAQTIANVSMVVIETAKAEVSMVKALGGGATVSGFIQVAAPTPAPAGSLEHPAPGVTVHRIR